MKLVRFGNPNEETPGMIDALGQLHDLSALCKDFDTTGLAQVDLIKTLMNTNVQHLPILAPTTRLGPCIKPGKIICIGFNSKIHNQEMGVNTTPKDITVFLKPTSAICGAFDPILHTHHMQKLDWEAELGIIIGKKGKYIAREHARDYILGYTCMNDLSERHWQFEIGDSQFTRGKGFDHAAPIGPYLVTKDEVPEPSNLQIQLWVNGILRQQFNSGDYIHNESTIISHLSQFFTLYPGDLISMGSGPGNARFWGEAFYLKPQDKVELSITGLGRQSQQVISEIY